MAKLHPIIERRSVSYEAITVAATAIGFTATKILPTSGDWSGVKCEEAFCTLETDSVRWTVDGTTPTASVGHLMVAGESLTLESRSDITNFRAIKVTNDASLKVTYKF